MSFIFSFVLSVIPNIFGCVERYAGVISFLDNLAVTQVPCCLGYYVLGYYLNAYDIKRKPLIYVLGILGFFLRLAESNWFSFLSGNAVQETYGNAMPNVLFSAAALFIFAKTKVQGWKEKKFITNLSKYTLCIYLVHPLVLDLLSESGINCSMFQPILAIPCVFVIVYLVSLLISFILNKIPFVKDTLI